MTGEVAATDVADAYGGGVMTPAVSSGLFDVTADVDTAVTIDDIVVADAFEATGAMPAVDVGNGIVAALGGGGTMDDDFGDLSHFKKG